ncbi:tRNA (adenosine(37)-N6)-threonylcarbamoyltransferase complex dimerization subunit type 1 TsaB [Mesoplasma photuris]|uniref:tRNA (adenosine(37)-N6)-threonylcarbamoyltransferase complex dimerization subunit type 1 TsaB n=1 Tax=Mesoplasma photuris TaxID=217731 RepID=UPI0004E1F83C|nr:tRNA (adenosine(37)-N6)-threonylcarbamoyltransferase complex dimerization subunit type 1 TsaB [Mesoplasma photuris]
MNLFIDTSNWNFVIILEKNNQIIDKKIILNTKKISDIAMDEISNLLNQNSLTIKNIENIYVTKGPGSYTGVRIGLTIAKTLKSIDKKYNIFLISSLKYQAMNEKVISIFDARGNKSYIGIYDQGISVIEETILSNEDIQNIVDQYSDFEIIKDYVNFDFVQAYLKVKDSFDEVKNVDDINPVYIKNFI